MTERSDDLIATITRLRSDVDELQRLGASRWGSANPNTAWGKVASASSTSNQTGIGAAVTDITFATATWTAVAGRLYRVTLECLLTQVTSAGDQAVQIVTGASGAGTVLAQAGQTGANIAATGTPHIGSITTYQTGSGSVSVHGRAVTSAGTLTIGNATVKGWFVVEDVGLA